MTRVLFIGNSMFFRYELPSQFINVANSLGEKVLVVGALQGSMSFTRLMTEKRGKMERLLEQDWDFIIVGEHTLWSQIKRLREETWEPFFKWLSKRKKNAQIITTSTQGSIFDKARCEKDYKYLHDQPWELKSIPLCNVEMQDEREAFECSSYASARAAFSSLHMGADIVAPFGFAFMIANKSTDVSEDCKELTDSEYDHKFPWQLPLKLTDSKFHKDLARSFDQHPSEAGQYLCALVLFNVIFGKSTVGAGSPKGIASDVDPDVPLSMHGIHALQLAADASIEQCGHACCSSSAL